MPLIIHHKDPSSILSSDKHEVILGTNLLSWIKSKWLILMRCLQGLSTTIMLNGKVIFTSDNENTDESLLDFTLGKNDCISIINRPGYEGVIYAIVIIIVAVAISLALAPSLPGDAGDQSTSPNNDLQAASNSFRPGQARPEIFGLNVSYPDFLQPTYFEYINNLKIVYELGYIGEGRYEVGELRNGETPYSSIPGSSFSIYQPGDTIPSELLTIHRAAEPVDGQALLAPDDESIQQLGEIDTITGGGASNILLTLIADSTLTSDLNLSIGGYISLSTLVITNGGGGFINIGTFEIVNLSIVAQRVVIEIGSVVLLSVPLLQTYMSHQLTLPVIINNYIGFFDIPGTSADEVWFNWQMPQGIRTESGKQLSIALEFQN